MSENTEIDEVERKKINDFITFLKKDSFIDSKKFDENCEKYYFSLIRRHSLETNTIDEMRHNWKYQQTGERRYKVGAPHPYHNEIAKVQDYVSSSLHANPKA